MNLGIQGNINAQNQENFSFGVQGNNNFGGQGGMNVGLQGSINSGNQGNNGIGNNQLYSSPMNNRLWWYYALIYQNFIKIITKTQISWSLV